LCLSDSQDALCGACVAIAGGVSRAIEVLPAADLMACISPRKNFDSLDVWSV